MTISISTLHCGILTLRTNTSPISDRSIWSGWILASSSRRKSLCRSYTSSMLENMRSICSSSKSLLYSLQRFRKPYSNVDIAHISLVCKPHSNNHSCKPWSVSLVHTVYRVDQFATYIHTYSMQIYPNLSVCYTLVQTLQEIHYRYLSVCYTPMDTYHYWNMQHSKNEHLWLLTVVH